MGFRGQFHTEGMDCLEPLLILPSKNTQDPLFILPTHPGSVCVWNCSISLGLQSLPCIHAHSGWVSRGLGVRDTSRAQGTPVLGSWGGCGLGVRG